MEWLNDTLFGNPFLHWFGATLVTALIFTLGFGLKIFATKRFSQQSEEASFNNLVLVTLRSSYVPLLAVLAVFVGSYSLVLPLFAQHTIRVLAIFSFFAQLGIWGSAAVTFWTHAYTVKSFHNGDSSRATTVAAIGFLGKGIVWSTVGILLLDNFGIKVSTLIAGLGIGGVAIALAVQNVLGDLLASLSIILDKPFVIGDTIRVDKEGGTVEQIGLKTTRLKSETGEQLIFSNSDLLKSRIRNFKRMEERRVSFRLCVAAKNSSSAVRRLPETIESIIRGHKNLRFERCYLAALTPNGSEFEIAYWVTSADFQTHAQALHYVNLEILSSTERDHIALSTNSLSLETNNES